MGAEEVAFGGDELIPVLLFAMSRVDDPARLVPCVTFLMDTCGSSVMNGEMGYYLSALVD